MLALAALTVLAFALPSGVGAASAATARHRLANAAVPAYCHMPAQHLHDNKTKAKYEPAEGGIAYDGIAAPITVHLTEHGTQLLAQFDCTAGGVGWPTVLVLYSTHNKLISSLRMDRFSDAEHSQVDKWHRKGHHVVASWSSYRGAGFDIHHHHSTITLRRGKLHLA